MGFGKSGKGTIIREHVDETLGTLGADTALLLSDLILTEDFRLMKSELFAIISGLSVGEGAGLLIGIANGELTVAEIKAAIEADGPLDRNDRAREELAMRFVKLFAQFVPNSQGTSGHFEGEGGSPMIVVKPRWTFSNPEGWNYFVYNAGPALTTGSSLTIVSSNFGVWLT